MVWEGLFLPKPTQNGVFSQIRTAILVPSSISLFGLRFCPFIPAVPTLVAISVSRNVLLYEDGLPRAGSGRTLQRSRFAGYFYDLMADKLPILKFLGE